MKYTKESLRARYLWRADHVEEYRRFSVIEANLIVIAMFLLGLGVGASAPGKWIAFVVVLLGFVLYLSVWIWDRRWERRMGVPELVKRDRQERSPTFDGR